MSIWSGVKLCDLNYFAIDISSSIKFTKTSATKIGRKVINSDIAVTIPVELTEEQSQLQLAHNHGVFRQQIEHSCLIEPFLLKERRPKELSPILLPELSSQLLNILEVAGFSLGHQPEHLSDPLPGIQLQLIQGSRLQFLLSVADRDQHLGEVAEPDDAFVPVEEREDVAQRSKERLQLLGCYELGAGRVQLPEEADQAQPVAE